MRCLTLSPSTGATDRCETLDGEQDEAMLPSWPRPRNSDAGGMNCVSPPCPGIVRDDQCPVCGLHQRRTTRGVTVEGPLNVTRRLRRISGRCDIPVMGQSANVGDGVVTVYLRAGGEVTRTFGIAALVSIEAV